MADAASWFEVLDLDERPEERTKPAHSIIPLVLVDRLCSIRSSYAIEPKRFWLGALRSHVPNQFVLLKYLFLRTKSMHL